MGEIHEVLFAPALTSFLCGSFTPCLHYSGPPFSHDGHNVVPQSLCSRTPGASSLLACGQFPGGASLKQSVLARLKRPLETRFTATSLGPTDQISGVIALGGSPARVREAARIASLYQGSKLIVTGASDEDYAAAQTYGLKPDRLVREPTRPEHL